MHKTAFVIYRKWAYQIYENLYEFKKERDCFTIDTIITTPQQEFKFSDKYKDTKLYTFDGNDISLICKTLEERGIQTVFFYGWSWIVKEPLISEFTCLCLHPSLLPKYRGGTPIQHQLIKGETKGGITVFKMDQGIDSGDIYKQLPMSLEGDINNIFERMIDLGTLITKQYISDYDNDELKFKPQKDLENHPPLKRRRPSDGMIDLNKLKNMKFEQLNNIVRGLLYPFPHAFIMFKEVKLHIKNVQKYSILPKNANLVTNDKELLHLDKVFFIKLKDSYAKIETIAS